jgi:uroporphyrin-III C-methyltransferase
MPPETPAMLAESIGHPEQRLLRTTIKQLAEQLTQETVTSTAVILYGALAADQP